MNESDGLEKLVNDLVKLLQAPDAEKLKGQTKIIDLLTSGMVIEGRRILKLEKEVAQLKEQLSKK